jgi:hypothetical protein
MNRFFELFGGPVAVLLSVIATIIIGRRWKAYRAENTRLIAVALLYWGPVFLMACMLLHIVQNAYRAIVSFNETGAFNFYYYSLQLFGFVVGYQSYLLLKTCRTYAGLQVGTKGKLFAGIGWIVLTTLPTLAFTPIGIIPSSVLLLTVFFSLAVHRSTPVRISRNTFAPAGNMEQDASVLSQVEL